MINWYDDDVDDSTINWLKHDSNYEIASPSELTLNQIERKNYDDIIMKMHIRKLPGCNSAVINMMNTHTICRRNKDPKCKLDALPRARRNTQSIIE